MLTLSTVLAVVLTQSRNAMGALALSVPFVMGPMQWVWLFPLLLLLASPLVLVVLPGVPSGWRQLAMALVPEPILDRLLERGGPTAWKHTRLGQWGYALELIAARPWLGWGAAAFSVLYPIYAAKRWHGHSHNLPLELAISHGLPVMLAIVGTVLLLLVLALPGVPAFYLPALLATPNDLGRFRRTGQRRDLNRPQFKADTVERRLQDPDSDATAVTSVLAHALRVRRDQPALHPDAAMEVMSAGRSDLVMLRRRGGGQTLVAVHNVTPSRLTLVLGRLGGRTGLAWADCLSGSSETHGSQLQLEPYAVHWLIQA